MNKKNGGQNLKTLEFDQKAFKSTFVDTLTKGELKQIIIEIIQEYAKENRRKLERNGVVFSLWTEAQFDSFRRCQLIKDLKIIGCKYKKSN